MRRLELRIPPPAVALAAGLLMWGIARVWPSFALAIPGRRYLAAAAALIGILVTAFGANEFRRARTTLNPLNPGATSELVSSRVYRLSRNPMYLGFALVLLGWSLYLSNPFALLGVAAFVAYITRFQIIPEERALRALFPGDFEEYFLRVRRWI